MSEARGHDTSYEWKATLVLSLAFGLVGLDRFILPSLFPSMRDDLGLNDQDLGNLVGILSVAWGAAAVLFGGLSDKVGRRRVLVPAVVFFSLMSGASGMAAGLTSLLLIRAIMGVAEGAVAPTGVAVVVEASHPHRRGINNGFFQCAIALFGLGVAPIMATQLSSLFKHRNIPLSMLALLCAMVGIFVLSAFIPSYLADYLKLELTDRGFVSSAIGFGGAIGQFGIPAVSDFIGRRMATALSFVISAVFLWFFIHTPAGDNTLLFVLLFGAALFNFGGGVAPSIAGAVAQSRGVQYTLWLTMACLIAGLIVSVFLKETAPRKQKG